MARCITHVLAKGTAFPGNVDSQVVNVLPQMAQLKRMALDLLFPSHCINCGREGEFICEHCRPLLTFISTPVCTKCGRPILTGQACSRCVEEWNDIDGVRAPFSFEGLVRKSIHELKYRNIRALAATLALFMYECLQNNNLAADVIIPVPLHPKRLRERGYNQSSLLARELGKLCGIPVVENLLIKCLHTRPQAQSLGVDERRQNIKNAYKCVDKRYEGNSILLVDDVTTSGSTLNACASELKSTGVVSVWGLVTAIEL